MQDRIPTYPGRVKLTPVSGQADTYDMTMADQPTQAGTPPTKANLLTDATAARLGLTSDPTVNDALNALNYQIGDTLTTVRTDLGDNWLLCNGDAVDAAQYPELAAKLGGAFMPSVSMPFSATDGTYYVTARYGKLYYSTDPSAAYTELSTTYSVYGGCVCYSNGTWYCFSSQYSSRFLEYTTNLFGTWTVVNLTSSMTSNHTIFKLVAFNNEIYGAAYYNNYVYVYKLSTSGSATIVTQFSVIGETAKLGFFGALDGKLVFAYPNRALTSTNTGTLFIYYSADGTTWNNQTTTSDYYGWVFPDGDGNLCCLTTKGKLCVFQGVTSTTPTATKQLVELSSSDYFDELAGVYVPNYGYIMIAGKWGVLDNIHAFYLSDLNADSVEILINYDPYVYLSSTMSLPPISAANQNSVIVYGMYNSNTQTLALSKSLPTISPNGAYTYIKAKEATA